MTLSKFLICCVSVFVACATMGAQPYTITRLNKENVRNHLAAFEQEFAKNRTWRKIATAGITVGGTAAAAALVYLMFFAKTEAETSKMPSMDTPEGLKAVVEKHDTLIKSLLEIKKLKFGSLKWAKSWAWYIVGSSFVIGTLIDKAFYYGSALFNKVFYARSVCWFLSSRTVLGSVVLKKVDERDQYCMSWSDVVKELEQSASQLQESSVDDAEYHKQRIARNMSIVMNELESIIAFIRYWLSTINGTSAAKQDMCDRVHHIKVISNKAVENCTSLLNSSQAPSDMQKYLPLIKRYCAELEQELIGIVRDEQELLRQSFPA